VSASGNGWSPSACSRTSFGRGTLTAWSGLEGPWIGGSALLLAIGLVFGCAQIAPRAPLPGLGGTSWQLVKFQGGDDTVLVPDDKAKYTIAFAADGHVNVRFDCNRGRGTWALPGLNQLQFGPLALTRAMCPPGSLHDRIVRQWPFVRSYTMKDGTYEFEPLRSW